MCTLLFVGYCLYWTTLKYSHILNLKNLWEFIESHLSNRLSKFKYRSGNACTANLYIHIVQVDHIPTHTPQSMNQPQEGIFFCVSFPHLFTFSFFPEHSPLTKSPRPPADIISILQDINAGYVFDYHARFFSTRRTKSNFQAPKFEWTKVNQKSPHCSVVDPHLFFI